MEDGFISLREFERRFPVTLQAIQKAIHTQRVPVDLVRRKADGTLCGIHATEAWPAWQRNTDQTQAERSGSGIMNTPPPRAPAEVTESAIERAGSAQGQQESRPAAPGPTGGPSGDAGLFEDGQSAVETGKKDPHGYLEHRAKTEEFRAKQAELEYLRDLGLVESVEEAREADFRLFRMLRDKLINIPDRVATILAAEREPTRVHGQLTAEIKRVLSELSSFAGAEAAAGAAQRLDS